MEEARGVPRVGCHGARLCPGPVVTWRGRVCLSQRRVARRVNDRKVERSKGRPADRTTRP